MHPEKALFISGSMGLGHVVRNLAIVKSLTALVPAVDIVWLAVGRDLLELCVSAYEIAKKADETPKLVLVCGPRVDPEYLHVQNRLKRYGAGVPFRFGETSPATLAGAILDHVSEPAEYSAIDVGGVAQSAEVIASYLTRRGG